MRVAYQSYLLELNTAYLLHPDTIKICLGVSQDGAKNVQSSWEDETKDYTVSATNAH